MSQESINQQLMQNEFKDYEIKFNNTDHQCLVTVTYKNAITLNAVTSRDILDKINTVTFLIKEFERD